MHERGEIHSPDRARQLRDFSGLRFGNITPTDIDGLIEYHDKAYILIETKLKGNQLEIGQRLALERITDTLGRVKRSICLIAEHEHYDVKENINVANSIIVEIRYNNKWQYPKELITTFEQIARFINYIEPMGVPYAERT